MQRRKKGKETDFNGIGKENETETFKLRYFKESERKRVKKENQ